MKYPLTFDSKKGSTVIIRPIGVGDLDAMLSFVNAFAKEPTYMMISGLTFTRRQEKTYLESACAAMRKKEKIHLIAIADNKIVASAEVRRQPARKNHVGVVGVAVLEQWRGVGLGKRLMQLLISEAIALGLKLLVLESYEKNTGAIKLYEKMGFRSAGMVPGMCQYQSGYQGCVIMYRPLVTV
jgi:ribosomal protein S18 acetylase RimI-like enzyme